jgi:hypothetical protein
MEVSRHPVPFLRWVAISLLTSFSLVKRGSSACIPPSSVHNVTTPASSVQREKKRQISFRFKIVKRDGNRWMIYWTLLFLSLISVLRSSYFRSSQSADFYCNRRGVRGELSAQQLKRVVCLPEWHTDSIPSAPKRWLRSSSVNSTPLWSVQNDESGK